MIAALHSISPLYVASGFAVGLLVGVTGVGGGSLMTPLLVLLFGIHPSTAVGTDLLYAGLTKMGGTLVHGRNRTVDWSIVGRLALGSVPAAVATLIGLAVVGKGNAQTTSFITSTLGVALLLTAVAIVLRQYLLGRITAYTERLTEQQRNRLTTLLGVVLGVLVSVSSVGAGAIGVTVLLALHPRMPIARLVGSDIAHAVPLTLVAGVGHWFMGSIDWMLLVTLLIGSLPGITLGSHVAARVPERFLRPVLASTLAIVGGRLVF